MDEFISRILELALGQGLWAVLYVCLLFRMLSENENREQRYQTTIDQLNNSIINKVTNIQTTLDEIAIRDSHRKT